MNFGNVKNGAKSDATNVTVDVTFNVIALSDTFVDGALKAKIGGQAATLPDVVSTDPVSSMKLFAVYHYYHIRYIDLICK